MATFSRCELDVGNDRPAVVDPGFGQPQRGGAHRETHLQRPCAGDGGPILERDGKNAGSPGAADENSTAGSEMPKAHVALLPFGRQGWKQRYLAFAVGIEEHLRHVADQRRMR